jgi:hypothetical protein
MRTSMTVVGALCAMAASSALPSVAQDHAAHHATPPAATATRPDHGQRWGSDAALRKGMEEIRAAVGALQHYQHGHIGPEQAATLATRVEAQVAYLVANCTLEPQADAALHAIIAKLLQGAAALKTDPRNLDAIATLRQALQDYPRQFDDPGWTTVEPRER